MSTHRELQTATVTMARTEAERAMRTLNLMRVRLTSNAMAVRRKRSWPASVKAMTLADYAQQIESIEVLEKLIGTAFNLGGW